MTTENMETTSQDHNTGVETTNDEQNTQVNDKTFTQEELNAIVANRVAKEQKRFEGIDVEEYRTLKQKAEEAETASLMKREEFDKVLKQTKEKSDAEVQKLRQELEKVKVDGALLNAASKLKTANPEHVVQLLKNNVKLDENGQPVVLNNDGEIRYNSDTAEQFTIDALVEEFVSSNPYFKSAGKTGTGAQGNNSNAESDEFDLSKLDLTKAEDRKVYAKMKKEGKI